MAHAAAVKSESLQPQCNNSGAGRRVTAQLGGSGSGADAVPGANVDTGGAHGPRSGGGGGGSGADAALGGGADGSCAGGRGGFSSSSDYGNRRQL